MTANPNLAVDQKSLGKQGAFIDVNATSGAKTPVARGPAGGADEMKSWHPFSSTFAAKEASLADMGKGPSWTKIIEN